jgi:hypothetical protein
MKPQAPQVEIQIVPSVPVEMQTARSSSRLPPAFLQWSLLVWLTYFMVIADNTDAPVVTVGVADVFHGHC